MLFLRAMPPLSSVPPQSSLLPPSSVPPLSSVMTLSPAPPLTDPVPSKFRPSARCPHPAQCRLQFSANPLLVPLLSQCRLSIRSSLLNTVFLPLSPASSFSHIIFCFQLESSAFSRLSASHTGFSQIPEPYSHATIAQGSGKRGGSGG